MSGCLGTGTVPLARVRFGLRRVGKFAEAATTFTRDAGDKPAPPRDSRASEQLVDRGAVQSGSPEDAPRVDACARFKQQLRDV